MARGAGRTLVWIALLLRRNCWETWVPASNGPRGEQSLQPHRYPRQAESNAPHRAHGRGGAGWPTGSIAVMRALDFHALHVPHFVRSTGSLLRYVRPRSRSDDDNADAMTYSKVLFWECAKVQLVHSPLARNERDYGSPRACIPSARLEWRPARVHPDAVDRCGSGGQCFLTWRFVRTNGVWRPRRFSSKTFRQDKRYSSAHETPEIRA